MDIERRPLRWISLASVRSAHVLFSNQPFFQPNIRECCAHGKTANQIDPIGQSVPMLRRNLHAEIGKH